jgi:hypothetical protein
MIATESARMIVMILLGLSVVWVIACLVRNDTETIVRALIITAVLGLVFFYLHHTKLETLSYKSVKEDLFPGPPLILSYEKTERDVNGVHETVYAFAEPGPELEVSMEEGGKYLTIPDVDPLNRVLEYMGLPPVKHGVPELASITGSPLDVGRYRWDDYELGTLILERGICRNIRTAKTYPCIEVITVRAREPFPPG